MGAGGYISSDGNNYNVNMAIINVNRQLKDADIELVVKSANSVIIDNVTRFEITIIIKKTLHVLYALDGRLVKVETMIENNLYRKRYGMDLKFVYIDII